MPQLLLGHACELIKGSDTFDFIFCLQLGGVLRRDCLERTGCSIPEAVRCRSWNTTVHSAQFCVVGGAKEAGISSLAERAIELLLLLGVCSKLAEHSILLQLRRTKRRSVGHRGTKRIILLCLWLISQDGCSGCLLSSTKKAISPILVLLARCSEDSCALLCVLQPLLSNKSTSRQIDMSEHLICLTIIGVSSIVGLCISENSVVGGLLSSKQSIIGGIDLRRAKWISLILWLRGSKNVLGLLLLPGLVAKETGGVVWLASSKNGWLAALLHEHARLSISLLTITLSLLSVFIEKSSVLLLISKHSGDRCLLIVSKDRGPETCSWIGFDGASEEALICVGRSAKDSLIVAFIEHHSFLQIIRQVNSHEINSKYNSHIICVSIQFHWDYMRIYEVDRKGEESSMEAVRQTDRKGRRWMGL